MRHSVCWAHNHPFRKWVAHFSTVLWNHGWSFHWSEVLSLSKLFLLTMFLWLHKLFSWSYSLYCVLVHTSIPISLLSSLLSFLMHNDIPLYSYTIIWPFSMDETYLFLTTLFGDAVCLCVMEYHSSQIVKVVIYLKGIGEIYWGYAWVSRYSQWRTT